MKISQIAFGVMVVSGIIMGCCLLISQFIEHWLFIYLTIIFGIPATISLFILKIHEAFFEKRKKVKKNIKLPLIFLVVIGIIFSVGLMIIGYTSRMDFDSFCFYWFLGLSLIFIFGGILGLLTDKVVLSIFGLGMPDRENYPKSYWIFNLFFIIIGVIMLIFTWYFKLE